MSVQDKLERTLRDIHVTIARGKEVPGYEDYVLLYKKDMLKLLDTLNEVVSEMMEEYEITEQSRAKAEREAEKRRESIMRKANSQSEDIYAASVLYTDDALGRIQTIIEEAGNSMKEIMVNVGKEIEQEQKRVRSNQRELKSQLEELKDTSKYIRIIEERNKEIAKEKAMKEEQKKPERYERKNEEKQKFVPVSADIKINEEYFERAGLTPEGVLIEKETPVYEKPEIKINKDYFRRAGIPLESENKPEDGGLAGHPKSAVRKMTIAEALKEARDEKQALTEDEIDTEIEAKLKEDLDEEYFQWKNGEKQPDRQEKKSFLDFLKNF